MRPIVCFALTPLVGCAALAPPQPTGMPSPEDWRDEVIYQVITDRFADGDPSNNEANPMGNRGVMGGDFAGLTEHLDHVEGLGATAIWISPISLNVGGAYHGYSAYDFRQVDPHWGTEEELRAFVDEAHRRGIRVIFDVICNHLANLVHSTDERYPEHLAPPEEYELSWSRELRYPPPFDDLSLFHAHGGIDAWEDPQVQLGELFRLDDLVTTDPRVRREMTDIWSDMIRRFDVDGYRIDTAKHVEMGFWEEWAPAIHRAAAEMGKDAFFLYGEVWHGDMAYLAPYSEPLDSVTDFPRYYRTLDVFARATAGPVSLEEHHAAVAEHIAPHAQGRMVTFLDNHDVSRFLHTANEAASPESGLSRLEAALVYHLTAPGVPVIYYGTEEGFGGGGQFLGGGSREPMWFEGGDHFDSSAPLYRHIARLNRLRRDHAALRRGEMTVQSAPREPGILAYTRSSEGEAVLVLINTDPDAGHVADSIPTPWEEGTPLTDALDPGFSAEVEPDGQLAPLSLPPNGYRVLVPQG